MLCAVEWITCDDENYEDEDYDNDDDDDGHRSYQNKLLKNNT